jgi:hopanoid-associated phosphorylase
MIIAVCGLMREARIVAGADVITIAGGGDALALREKLERAIAPRIRGIISIGIAGALSPTLKLGECVIASHIIAGNEIFPTDAEWSKRLTACFPGAVFGAVAGSDGVVANVSDKSALNRATGSCAVDMESHVVARTAKAHGLPFAALRVICDTAATSLPPAVLVAMKPDGAIRFGAVARSLLRRPFQIPDLLRTARESKLAFAALLRCRDALGPSLGFGGLDLG